MTVTLYQKSILYRTFVLCIRFKRWWIAVWNYFSPQSPHHALNPLWFFIMMMQVSLVLYICVVLIRILSNLKFACICVIPMKRVCHRRWFRRSNCQTVYESPCVLVTVRLSQLHSNVSGSHVPASVAVCYLHRLLFYHPWGFHLVTVRPDYTSLSFFHWIY